MVRRLKQSSGVQVNGQAVYLNTRLQEGDRLSVDLRLSKGTEVTPQPIPIDIVYEDEHLLVVSKPAGMLVHPLKHEPENTLANAVLYHYTLNGTEPVFRPLTRLDRDTSGLVILAKSAHAGYRLTQQMGTGELWREYFASAHGLRRLHRVPWKGGSFFSVININKHVRTQDPSENILMQELNYSGGLHDFAKISFISHCDFFDFNSRVFMHS